MDQDTLREHLAQLHQELDQVHRIDPHSNRLLGELMQDLKRLTDAPPAGKAAGDASVPAAADAPLADRLEKIAVQFEAAHPTLAASSRRLVDLLGKAGV